VKTTTLRRFHQKLSVPFDYPVVFTRDLFHPENPLLVRITRRLGENRNHRVLVCLDAGLRRHAPGLADRIRGYFQRHHRKITLAGPIQIAGPTRHLKDGLDSVRDAIGWMAARNLDRHSFVMIVGGGNLLDSAGLAAALVHRGLRVIRVPTTVTAQNDVGVGVKTGVDAFGAKNFLGVFAPPFAVLNDLDFLVSLPQRERLAGIAEAFKVAMIKDRRFFADLCRDARLFRRGDIPALERAIIRCAQLHLDHIRLGGDPFETGSARPLDFGHWSAHHLETASGYRLRHGEAVAIGIALDAHIAADRGLIARREANRLVRAMRSAGLVLWHPQLLAHDRQGRPRLLEGLRRFQEHLGGKLTLTLPGPLGARVEIHALTSEEILRAVHCLRRTATPRRRTGQGGNRRAVA